MPDNLDIFLQVNEILLGLEIFMIIELYGIKWWMQKPGTEYSWLNPADSLCGQKKLFGGSSIDTSLWDEPNMSPNFKRPCLWYCYSTFFWFRKNYLVINDLVSFAFETTVRRFQCAKKIDMEKKMQYCCTSTYYINYLWTTFVSNQVVACTLYFVLKM